jgi:hypothetical protein
MPFDFSGTVLNRKLRIFSGNLKGFRWSQKDIWFRVLRDQKFKEWILDLVRQDQLFKEGVDEDNDVIGYYSEWTEMMNPKKVAGTHYTLFDTGEFYKSFILRVGKNYFEIDADPLKTNENGETTNLFYKYSESILGLTEESKDKLARELIRRFAIEVRRVVIDR